MKHEYSRLLMGAAVVLVASIGCGTTVEAGLANSPTARRNRPPRNQHDVISNGPESCGDQEPGGQYRQPKCPSNDADSGVAVVPPPPEK